jgi:DNA-binding MarR family transcriptional regulator
MNDFQDPDCFVPALLAAAHRIEERLETELAATELSAAKLRVLTQLVRAGKPLAISELAESQRCVRSNITQIIDRLETNGLVRRVHDPVDRRVVRAQLTARGRERQKQGADVFHSLQAEITGALSAADRESLERVLAALNGHEPIRQD